MSDRDADALPWDHAHIAENETNERFIFAVMLALELAPDTLRRWGVDAQRSKCLEELDELATVLTSDRGALESTVEVERAIIDEGADVIITAICACASIGALNWKEQLADRIAFKVARTRTRMGQP